MTEEPKEKIETQIPIDEADKQKAKKKGSFFGDPVVVL